MRISLWLPAGLLLLSSHAPLPQIVANDNRTPAGAIARDTLVVQLKVVRAQWYPEAEDGESIVVEAFGEGDGPPRIPAPLLRAHTGQPMHVTIRNELPDSTIHVIGLASQPVPLADTLHIAPGETREVRFNAGAPGTYLYRAVIGYNPDDRKSEHEAAGGAFVVDPASGSVPDRVFVLNIYGDPVEKGFRNALAINGKSWPYTEQVQMSVGDTAHWRVINGTARSHPMHLHGFYFQETAHGDGLKAASVPQPEQHLAVTESMVKWSTHEYTWSPDRPGNWLFHCHLTFHVVAETGRLLGKEGPEHQAHSADPRQHMAGLVLGINVMPRAGALAQKSSRRQRRIDLYVQERAGPANAPRPMSYIAQQGKAAPAADSIQHASSLLVMTRGEETAVVVHNRLREATAIHWHGVELQSWSDGVVGWSNNGKNVAPPIAAGDSFVAHLETPRAGTFIYHTHLNDLEQATSGLTGPLIVLEPGQKFDAATDHVYLGHWRGDGSLLINGDSLEAPGLTLQSGTTQRFRFINVGLANNISFKLLRDGKPVDWSWQAKDGADVPATLRPARKATQLLSVGETFDFEVRLEPGTYELTANFAGNPDHPWRQKITVN